MSEPTTPPFTHRLRMALPAIAAVIFFILGFAADGWAWAWIVFLLVPIGYALLPHPPRSTTSLRKE